MLASLEDDDCCGFCGIRTDVIGPPGPRHRSYCPEAIAAQAESETTRMRDRLFLSRYQGRQPCGCFVSGDSILEICLKRECVLLRE